MDCSISQSIGQSTNQFVNRSINQSNDRSTNRSLSQSIASSFLLDTNLLSHPNGSNNRNRDFELSVLSFALLSRNSSSGSHKQRTEEQERTTEETARASVTDHKGPFKRTQHVACNIIQHCCMQHVASFEHPVARCCMKFEPNQTSCNIVQHRATGCSNDATCCAQQSWMMLHATCCVRLNGA